MISCSFDDCLVCHMKYFAKLLFKLTGLLWIVCWLIFTWLLTWRLLVSCPWSDASNLGSVSLCGVVVVVQHPWLLSWPMSDATDGWTRWSSTLSGWAPMLRGRCPADAAARLPDTHLLARQPPSIYHYWIIDRTAALSYKGRPFKWFHSVLCVLVGAARVLARWRWCVVAGVARTRTPPPIGCNHGAPDPPPPPPPIWIKLMLRQSPKAPIASETGGADWAKQLNMHRLLQLVPNKNTCQLCTNDNHWLLTVKWNASSVSYFLATLVGILLAGCLWGWLPILTLVPCVLGWLVGHLAIVPTTSTCPPSTWPWPTSIGCHTILLPRHHKHGLSPIYPASHALPKYKCQHTNTAIISIWKIPIFPTQSKPS